MVKEYNEAYEEWKEKVEYDFEHLDPKVGNADLDDDLVCSEHEELTAYDYEKHGYKVGRRDGVKEVLRDLRRYAQYAVSLDDNPHCVLTREDIYNFIDRKYKEIGEWKKQK